MANKTNTKHGALGFETLKDVSQVVGKQFNGTADNVFEQIFGGSFGSNPGQERAPQQEQPVSEKGLIFQMSSEAKGKPKQAEKKDFTPGINYMKELQEQTISKQEAQKISEQVDQIMVELQRLINSAPGVLQAQFADIAVGQ